VEFVTAFLGSRQIATGSRDEVVRTIRDSLIAHDGAVLVFDDQTGRITDLDYHEVAAQAPGRPRLGVKAREVTLLPRHWEWLSDQPGGASAALRRLVDAARSGQATERQRRDAVYRFMQATCGDMAGYEEALRALYAAHDADFLAQIESWPIDIVGYIHKLLTGSPHGSGAEAIE
jgi:hypothetical protein